MTHLGMVEKGISAQRNCRLFDNFTCPYPNGYFAVEESRFCSNFYHCVLGLAVPKVPVSVQIFQTGEINDNFCTH